VRTGTCSTYGHSLVMRGGKISEVDAQVPPTDAVVVNCGGLLLMPGTFTAAEPPQQLCSHANWEAYESVLLCAGLCDAHVHVTATTANLAGLYRYVSSPRTAAAQHMCPCTCVTAIAEECMPHACVLLVPAQPVRVAGNSTCHRHPGRHDLTRLHNRPGLW
jgi:hypothetical protein